MDAAATASKRPRDDSELECELTPVSMTNEPTQSGEPLHHQPHSERDDSPNGGKQDSVGDGAQPPPRKKNRRYKQQQQQQQQRHHNACAYCLATGKAELASEHPLMECHWKLASDAMSAYDLAEGILKQKHEAEIAVLKARHDAVVKTLRDQLDARIYNLKARVTNLQDKNGDMADRIGALTKENNFLTTQNEYVHDTMDQMAQKHAQTLDKLASQHNQEVAMLTGQYEKEIDAQQNKIKLMEKEKLRLVDANRQLRVTLTLSHEKEIDRLVRIIEDMEAAQEEDKLVRQHKGEIRALENRHKKDIERITAELEAEHAAKIKKLQEAQRVELLVREHQFEDKVDLIRYESEVKNEQLEQELSDARGKCWKLRGELDDAREKIQLHVEKKAALDRKPKLDGYLQHLTEKLKKEVTKSQAMASEFKMDREIFQMNIRDLEVELESTRSAIRALECMLRSKGVTDEEIKAQVRRTAMRWDLDAECSDESGATDSDSDSDSNSELDEDSDQDTDAEMREGDTNVDEEEEDGESEEDQEVEEEAAVDREDSFHGFDESEGADPDSVDEGMSDAVSESTELDEDEHEAENKSVQDDEESSSSSSHCEAVSGDEEVSSFSSEKFDLWEEGEVRASPPSPVIWPVPGTPVSQSQPYNPAAPIVPIPLDHMPTGVTIGEGARQMAYVHDPYSSLSGGYWVETVNPNAAPIPQQQQQQQQQSSPNPGPTRSARRGREDDDESTTLDFEEEKEADDDDDDGRTVCEYASSLEEAIARGWTIPPGLFRRASTT